ncbi:O-antigen ligase family protein [Vibrio sp. ZSDZ34]|uniref:O-antigen ligase family protein n=1 Tax=Vibrio gelatinilyticus TaxID=2893468 RepID=A0A9X1WG23_9VIBR|nr:O-antigen ligase family protein [Vibrio gelatinilyticus]MCJ2378608.1 O-antigen ligase family protein [Vibrio gelatinilyticus]
MKSLSLLSRVNLLFLIGFSISIPASKAGMNLFLYTYLLSSFALLRFDNVQLNDSSRWVLKSSLIVFGLGIVLALFSKGFDKDAIVYIQKYAYLLFPGALLISIHKSKRFAWWSIGAFILSVIVCLSIDLYSFAIIHDFFHNRGVVRLWGQIGYSRWPIVLVTAMTIALLVELNTKKWLLKGLAWLFVALALVGLALSGSKGGIVAVGVVGFAYLLILAKKNWFIAPVVLLLVFVGVNSELFQKTIGQRGLNTETITASSSTQARLVMIKTGAALSVNNLQNDIAYFLFGGGIENPEEPFQNALDKLPDQENQALIYRGKHWGHTDLHNSYLDQLLKSGVIFSILFYWLIIQVTFRAFKGLKTVEQYHYLPSMFATTLVSYVVFNAFYSNFSDYAIYSQIYLIAIALASPNILNKSTPVE